MWRGSTYHLSQASLEYFANAFNSLEVCKNIRWEYIREETFSNDGWFVNLETGETIGYDWEIRDDYWDAGKFPFDTLGQFERKFDPAKAIKLSIQCSKNCSAIVVAWHEDFAEEKVTDIQLATDSSEKENGKTRYTKHFRVFRFDEMELFKQLISKAFQTKTYNHTIFDTAESEKGVQPSNPPICPRCGRPLLKKANKSTGTIFWGCSGYRRDGAGCNYTKKIKE